MSDFTEVKVNWEVHAFVLDCQSHIPTIIGGTLPKSEVLPINLNLRVLSSRHHLNFQISVLNADFTIFIELDHSQGSILLGSDIKPLLLTICLV